MNPHFKARHHQPKNIIDARFIDTLSGYYIDITGVAIVKNGTGAIHSRDLVQCKSVHRYSRGTLFPLVRTLFEGVPTWCPNDAVGIVAREYIHFDSQKYRDYEFNVTSSRWEISSNFTLHHPESDGCLLY